MANNALGRGGYASLAKRVYKLNVTCDESRPGLNKGVRMPDGVQRVQVQLYKLGLAPCM